MDRFRHIELQIRLHPNSKAIWLRVNKRFHNAVKLKTITIQLMLYQSCTSWKLRMKHTFCYLETSFQERNKTTAIYVYYVKHVSKKEKQLICTAYLSVWAVQWNFIISTLTYDQLNPRASSYLRS